MEGFWCFLIVLYLKVHCEWFNVLPGMPEMYLYDWCVRKKRKNMCTIIFLMSSNVQHYIMLYQVNSFYIIIPLNTSPEHHKCLEVWPVKRRHLHSSRSDPRPSTTSDTRGGEREKRVQSVKNTLKNSSHTPFHLGERNKDRSVEVEQMRTKRGVCFSPRSAQHTLLWRLACLTEIPLRLHSTGGKWSIPPSLSFSRV